MSGTGPKVQALSVDRCREILGYGALRGLFRRGELLGLCGYRPQMFARMAHRVELGPFYVTRKAQGTGVADPPRRAARGAAWSSFMWMRRTTAPLPFTSGTGSDCWRICPIACASTMACGSICCIVWSWTLEVAHEKADL